MDDRWDELDEVGALTPEGVFVARLDGAALRAEVTRFRSMLTALETERADAYVHIADRDRYAIRRGALRVLLGAFTESSPSGVGITTGKHGKPTLAGDGVRGLEFNTSHSDDLVLFAFASVPIGIDVEAVRDDLPYLEMARRFFSPAEREALFAVGEEERLGLFFDVWVRKEAYVKAVGHGLTIAPESFSVGLQAGDVVDHGGRSDERLWATNGIEAGPRHRAACASEVGGGAVRRADVTGAVRRAVRA